MSKAVIVLGGAGALGRAVVNSLKKNSMTAICVDLLNNKDAKYNVTIDSSASLASQVPSIKAHLSTHLKDLSEPGFAAGVVSCAGSWAGGSISDDGMHS